MGQPPLKKRSCGYQLSGCERTLIFEKEDIGYVRYLDARKGIFYLDPSPFLETVEPVIYFVKAGTKPPKGQLIEAVVTESEIYYENVKGSPIKKWIKYIIGWKKTDPNIIRGNKSLSKEDYMEALASPIKGKEYSVEDAVISIALYTVACPPPTDFDQGGINTVVMTTSEDAEKWKMFNRITDGVPLEFRRINARNFYQSYDNETSPFTDGSVEVSPAYLNKLRVKPNLMFNFDYNFKSSREYKEDMEVTLPLRRAFMIDALLFNPEIPDSYIKKFHEVMHEMRESAWTLAGENPAASNFSDTAVRLAMALARLGFREEVSKTDIDNAVDNWAEGILRGSWSQGAARDFKGNPNLKGYFDRSPEEKRMLAEIWGLKNAGEELTTDNLKKHTSVPPHKFAETLDRLRYAGYIYLPGNGRIGILEE